ncbi:hypothetical protein Ct61P_09928 [Colletotrichum tofieldiae]|nr:hypothetical protein Ct61P_09928 [Colletotrichum tofieldiae]
MAVVVAARQPRSGSQLSYEPKLSPPTLNTNAISLSPEERSQDIASWPYGSPPHRPSAVVTGTIASPLPGILRVGLCQGLRCSVRSSRKLIVLALSGQPKKGLAPVWYVGDGREGLSISLSTVGAARRLSSSNYGYVGRRREAVVTDTGPVPTLLTDCLAGALRD